MKKELKGGLRGSPRLQSLYRALRVSNSLEERGRSRRVLH
jgi:hypothetical protein